MGASYGHLLVLGSTEPQIIAALADEPAYLATFDGVVAIFSQSAAADPQTNALLLSSRTAGDVLGFVVVDDDVLGCTLCRDNEIVADVSVPTLEDYAGISADELELMAEYLDEAVPNAGATNDPAAFVFGLGRGDARTALHILSDDWHTGEQASASQRHRELIAALGLPEAIVGWDYYQFDAGIEGFEGPIRTHAVS